jgi:hypothetical protein
MMSRDDASIVQFGAPDATGRSSQKREVPMKTWLMTGGVMASLALGVFGGWLIGSSAGNERVESASGGGDPALRELVQIAREIADEVRQVRSALGPASSPAREPVAEKGGGGASDRLATELERLAKLLEQKVLAGGGAVPHAVVPDAAPHPENVAAALRVEGEARMRAHLFWNYQRVLDRYGPPVYISAGSQGVLTWTYSEPGGEKSLVFEFFDGFVINSY